VDDAFPVPAAPDDGGMRPADLPPGLTRGPFTVEPPGTLATGVTGLRLHGVEVGDPGTLHFVTKHPGPIRRPGLRVTRVSVLPEAWDAVVVVPEHCWLVAALDLNLLDLVIAADWLLRLRLLNLRTLESYVVASRSGGAGTARRAIGLVRERVHSPRETWLRVPGPRRVADARLQSDHPRGRRLLAR